MKKMYLLALVLIIWQSNIYCQETSRNFSVRPYVQMGFTAAVPTLEELGYLVVDGPPLSEDHRKVDALSYGLGIQALYGKGNCKFGLEIGGMRLFKSTVILDNTDVNLGISTNIDREMTSQILVIAQGSLAGIFFAEAGIGPRITLWTYSYEYLGRYGNTYEDDWGVKVNFGIMAAGGVDIPISRSISIPIYVRMDMLFRYGVIVPLTINSGITVRL